MREHLALTGLVLGAGLLLSGSGCSQPTAAETSDARAAAGPSSAGTLDRVRAAHPERKTLQLYTAQPGRVEAFEETPLYPKLTGYVQEVLVDIGDPVARDQVLVKLWIPEMQDELAQKEALVAQAEAEVKQARAAVQAARAAVSTAQARVTQAEAGVGRAEAEYELWSDQYDRIRELAARGSQTQKLVDETLSQFRAADAARKEVAANVLSAQAGLNEAEAHVAKAEADRVAAQARQRVAQADLSRTKTLLAYTDIKAPYDGVVTRRGIDTGHYVQPANGAAAPLLVVARTDRVRIFVDVPEMEAPLVDGGETADPAVVRVQSLGGREFQAQVTRTGWALDTSNRSLRTEVDLTNEDGQLRPGMYATVAILLDQRDNVLSLPTTAILRDGSQSYCCCVESGRVVRREIELGLRSGDDVEVVSGLDESATVVLVGADSLQEGQQVEVIEDDN